MFCSQSPFDREREKEGTQFSHRATKKSALHELEGLASRSLTTVSLIPAALCLMTLSYAATSIGIPFINRHVVSRYSLWTFKSIFGLAFFISI